MPAHESLHDDQFEHFFHGSARDVPGDTLLPSAKTGHENYDYGHLPDPEERRNNVFMMRGGGHYPSPDEAEGRAWNWASGGGRPRVHEVWPVGKLKLDREGGGMETAFMAPKAKIRDTIWTPPVSHVIPYESRNSQEDWVVQGTLPHQDWNDYSNPRSTKNANWHAYSPADDIAKKVENDRWEGAMADRPSNRNQQQFAGF